MVYFNSSANMCPKNWLHLKIIKYEGLISSILGSRLVSDSHQNKWLKCKEGAPQTVGLADTLYSIEWLTEASLQPPGGRDSVLFLSLSFRSLPQLAVLPCWKQTEEPSSHLSSPLSVHGTSGKAIHDTRLCLSRLWHEVMERRELSTTCPSLPYKWKTSDHMAHFPASPLSL